MTRLSSPGPVGLWGIRGLCRSVRRLHTHAPRALLVLLVPCVVIVLATLGVSRRSFDHRDLAAATSALCSPEEPWRKLAPALMVEKPFLPPLGLMRGVSYEGTMLRMQSFAARLVRGKGVKVVAVGGSTTAGAGSYRGNVYHKRYLQWLEKTFPTVPGADVKLVVNGLGATRSALFNACAQRMVSDQGDLYILEFAVNDPWNEPIDGPTRHGFEQLVRRLLRGGKKPAVVILNQLVQAGTRGSFYRSAERDLAAIGEYYDVPVLSMRNAIWDLLGRPGFWVNGSLSKQIEELGPPPGKTTWRARYARGEPVLSVERQYLYWDGAHPADQTGQRVLSDLLVELTRRATRTLLSEDAKWWHDGRETPTLLPIPSPMLEGNWELNQSHCFMQDDILDRTVANKDFEWKPRKPEAATRTLQQWGFHTDKPGAKLTISLDTTLSDVFEEADKPGEDKKKKLETVDLVLAIVKSWGHYGLADVRCETGCTCEKTTIDCKWEYTNTQASLVPIEVTQAKNCTFSVTISPSLKNNGTKFEMRGALIVNHGSQLFSRPDNHGDVVAGNVNRRRRSLLGAEGSRGDEMREAGEPGVDAEMEESLSWMPLPGEDEAFPQPPSFIGI